METLSRAGQPVSDELLERSLRLAQAAWFKTPLPYHQLQADG